MAKQEHREDISLAGALTALGGILAILAGGTLTFGIHIAVLLALCGVFTTGLFRLKYGFGWRLLFIDGVLPMVSRASGALGILLSVGPLIAAWTLSGTIPYLVFTGLDILTPRIFLPAAFLLCSFASLLTGTSWGTAATFGVALTAIAGGLGIPAAAAAGARLVIPPPALCTDNGAMVAWAGAERLALGAVDGFDFAARARWPLDDADMGITHAA